MQANEASVSGKPDYVEADLLGLTEEGAIRAAADPAAFAALRIPNDPERSGPRFEGTLTEFEADCGGTSSVPRSFGFRLRVCRHPSGKLCLPSCTTWCESVGHAASPVVSPRRFAMDAAQSCRKRPCTQTTSSCLSFTASPRCPVPPCLAPDQPRISRARACTAAQGARFPYDIAVRLQTKELLVFDDPLALSPCHFCAIPTTCWCADWRLLLRAPKEGLALLTQLEEAAWRCMEEQFLSSAAWCAARRPASTLPDDPHLTLTLTLANDTHPDPGQ